MSNMSQILFCGRKNINLFCLSSEKHHFYSELCRFFSEEYSEEYQFIMIFFFLKKQKKVPLSTKFCELE